MLDTWGASLRKSAAQPTTILQWALIFTSSRSSLVSRSLLCNLVLGPLFCLRLLLQVHPLRWVVSYPENVRRFCTGRMWLMGILWWSCCVGLLYSCSDECLAVTGHSLATGRVRGTFLGESRIWWIAGGPQLPS